MWSLSTSCRRPVSARSTRRVCARNTANKFGLIQSYGRRILMTEYRTPLRDMKFVINDPADGNGELALPGFEELTPDLAGIDQTVLRGKAPRTLHLTADHKQRKKAADCEPIAYPEPDGELTFFQSSSVLLSNTNHEES